MDMQKIKGETKKINDDAIEFAKHLSALSDYQRATGKLLPPRPKRKWFNKIWYCPECGAEVTVKVWGVGLFMYQIPYSKCNSCDWEWVDKGWHFAQE